MGGELSPTKLAVAIPILKQRLDQFQISLAQTGLVKGTDKAEIRDNETFLKQIAEELHNEPSATKLAELRPILKDRLNQLQQTLMQTGLFKGTEKKAKRQK